MGGGSSASSSGEEDGDADWRAAIDSVAAAGPSNGPTKTPPRHEEQQKAEKPRTLKLYQIKDIQLPLLIADAIQSFGVFGTWCLDQNHLMCIWRVLGTRAQKLLDDLVGKRLEMVTSPIPLLGENHQANEGGIRLFSKAPPGMIVDPFDLHQQPRKRAKILPGDDIDEKSKKFKRQLRSVAVDGADIMAAARDACQRSLSRFEARDTAAKEAAKREEERVAELKKVKGERWLPSIAREMQELPHQR